jgi:hypothetical protein
LREAINRTGHAMGTHLGLRRLKRQASDDGAEVLEIGVDRADCLGEMVRADLGVALCGLVSTGMTQEPGDLPYRPARPAQSGSSWNRLNSRPPANIQPMAGLGRQPLQPSARAYSSRLGIARSQ